jgi:hypothetical protein
MVESHDIHVYDPEESGVPFDEDALLSITESMTKVFTVHGESGGRRTVKVV